MQSQIYKQTETGVGVMIYPTNDVCVCVYNNIGLLENPKTE